METEIPSNIILKVNSLYKSFNNNVVLEDISFELKENENIVILGKSGSGKSVLIKCIIGLLEFEKGNISILGQSINEISKKEWNSLRCKIGFLFQNNALYDSMTVKENLEFPIRRSQSNINEKELNEKIVTALKDVQLEQTMNMMPNELSGGMKKRIALARSLIMNPKIIFYDEPTTGLDPITSKEIIELMNSIKLKYKTSSVIITHDMYCVKKTSDKILLIWDGKCKGTGTYEELENKPEREFIAFFKKD